MQELSMLKDVSGGECSGRIDGVGGSMIVEMTGFSGKDVRDAINLSAGMVICLFVVFIILHGIVLACNGNLKFVCYDGVWFN